MRNVLSFILATLRAIQGFLDLHNTLLAEVNASGARKNLDALVQQLIDPVGRSALRTYGKSW